MDSRLVLTLMVAWGSLPVSAAPTVTAMGMSIAIHRMAAKALVKTLLFLMFPPRFLVDIAEYRVYTGYYKAICWKIMQSVRIIMNFLEILKFLPSGGSSGGLWDNKPSRLLEKIGLWRGKY